MCLDKFDKDGKPLNLNIYGVSGNDARSIELGFIPCVPKQLT